MFTAMIDSLQPSFAANCAAKVTGISEWGSPSVAHRILLIIFCAFHARVQNAAPCCLGTSDRLRGAKVSSAFEHLAYMLGIGPPGIPRPTATFSQRTLDTCRRPGRGTLGRSKLATQLIR